MTPTTRRYLGPAQAVAFLAAFAFGIPAEIGAQIPIFNGLDLAALIAALSFLALCAAEDARRHNTHPTTERNAS